MRDLGRGHDAREPAHLEACRKMEDVRDATSGEAAKAGGEVMCGMSARGGEGAMHAHGGNTSIAACGGGARTHGVTNGSAEAAPREDGVTYRDGEACT